MSIISSSTVCVETRQKIESNVILFFCYYWNFHCVSGFNLFSPTSPYLPTPHIVGRCTSLIFTVESRFISRISWPTFFVKVFANVYLWWESAFQFGKRPSCVCVWHHSGGEKCIYCSKMPFCAAGWCSPLSERLGCEWEILYKWNVQMFLLFTYKKDIVIT